MKIFRNLRIGMINNNRISGYLAYSFGEIILVVAGILIALSINNWNSDRKHQKKLNNIFAIVADDIRSDTTELGVIIRDYQKRKPLFLRVLGDSLSFDDFKTCRKCQSLATSFNSFSLNHTGKNLLSEFSSELGNDTLIMHIVQSYEAIENAMDVIGRPVSEDVYELLSLWRDKYDWYAKVITGNEDEVQIKYLFESPEYKNRLAHHYLLVYGNYLPSLENSNQELTALLAQIEQRIAYEK
jgi:hypothetical protein